MRKTVLVPDVGDAESAPASSLGTVVHHDDRREVTLSGAVWPHGDVEEQTRSVLEYVEGVLVDDLGGSLADVTHLRFFVREDHLSPAKRARIQDVRREFFAPPDIPGSTMVGVAALVDDDALLEVEAEAVLPADGWETERQTAE